MTRKEIAFFAETLCAAEIAHLERHQYQRDTDLIHRSVTEGKNLVTTFEDLNGVVFGEDQIMNTIRTLLLDEANQEDIMDWLEDESDGEPWALEMDFENPIGRGFFKEGWHEWNAGAATCRTFILMLSKVERRMDTCFRISSCYPTYNEVDKQELFERVAAFRQQRMAQ